MIVASPARVTLRSIAKTIDSAVELALIQKRNLLVAKDLDDTPFLYERPKYGVSNRNSTALSVIDDAEPVSDVQWQELINAARTGTLAEANALLRQIMVTYAGVRFSGNLVKISEALGVARSSLYRAKIHESVSSANTATNSSLL